MSNEVQQSEKAPKFLFSRIAVALIAAMWFVSGAMKIMDTAGFQETLAQHRVIPIDYRGFGMCLGPAEIMLGLFMIFAVGSELRKTFGRFSLSISLALIIAFTVYLNMVDPAVLQESGCGCLGDYRLAKGIERSEYYFAMIRNGALIGLHLVAIFGPIWTLRKIRQRNASASA